MSAEWTTRKLVDEIISEISLNDAVNLAYLNDEDIEILQAIFDQYIGIKTGLVSGDAEHKNIMNALWRRLQKTHKLRVVK